MANDNDRDGEAREAFQGLISFTQAVPSNLLYRNLTMKTKRITRSLFNYEIRNEVFIQYTLYKSYLSRSKDVTTAQRAKIHFNMGIL